MERKRGQVTIFIIIAIVIVGLGVAIYALYPRISNVFGGAQQSPEEFIRVCMEDSIRQTIDTLSSQGGSIEPERYFTYNENPIEYLCYTNENYKTCVVQQPLLKNHVESEIESNIKGDAEKCFDDLQSTFESRGYTVDLVKGDLRAELLPKRVNVVFENELTLTKGGDTQRYEEFNVVLNNNLYELISIANSIIEWEATYGEADVRTYMGFYPDLKAEKNLRDDGTKIYTLTDRNTGNKFQFASRSLVFPPGY
jgi:hypothetical protein